MTASKFTITPSPIEVVEKVNAVIDDVAGKLSTSGTAAKATADASGNTITSTYETKANAITGLSVSGKVITYTKGNGTTGTITTQDTTYTHPSSGVTAGTYSSVTVNAQGHVTAGSNPSGGYHTGNATSIGTASATKPAVIVTSYRSGTSWYRVWSDGWVEQGYTIYVDRDSTTTTTLIKTMKDTSYTIICSIPSEAGSSGGGYQWWFTKTTTTFSLRHYHWPAYYDVIIVGQGA